MAPIPATQPAPATPPETLEERFRRLAAAWEKAVSYQSSSRVRESHPAYLEIIALGQPVVPLLLRDLEQRETHWFSALHRITGTDPVPREAAGNIPLMVAAWLKWARETGYRW
jgi:hypothetical protein